ncbi:MAG: AraC family transcriptional regulator [Aerococcus sp.]|nr:AraC family transcriptional regulator [Aerococcus sp.]
MSDLEHEMVVPITPLVACVYTHQEAESKYVAPHWHQSVEVSFTLAGSIDHFFIDGTDYTTSPGDVLVVNSMAIHSVQVYNDPKALTKALAIVFPYSLLERYCPEINAYHFDIPTANLRSHEQQRAYQQLQRQLEELFAICSGHTLHRSLRKNILFLEILAILLRYFLVPSPVVPKVTITAHRYGMERLQKIKDYVENNYQGDIGLDDLADLCFLSREYLARFFKENMGVTIGQYINNVRARHAREALKHSEGTFTDIALACGFSGLRTMNRALNKNYGCTARDIRKQAQEN